MCRHLFAGATAILFFSAVVAEAQDSANLGDRFIPDEAVAMIQVKPRDLMVHPSLKLAPTEVLSAASKEYVGVDVSNVIRMRVVVGAPGPTPQFGVAVELSEDASVEDLNERIVDHDSGREIDGITYYKINDAPPDAVLAKVDSKTWVIGTQFFVGRMISAKGGDGVLPELARQTPDTGEANVLVAIEPIRPMFVGLAMQVGQELPPPLASLAQLPQVIDSIQISYYADKGFGADINLNAADASAAKQINETLVGAKEFGRSMVLALVGQSIEDEGPVADAMRAYGQRVTNSMFDMVKPVVKDSSVNLAISDVQTDLATTGTLIALLLPAVQAARQAARRVSGQNNLKQLALAVHNYHDTYQHFPQNIVDEDGNALLSWRVQLLPFLEEAELYEQFKLDEPWNSEHNRELIELMPPTLLAPEGHTDPTMTVYQAPTGEGIGMLGKRALRFRDILDGTANTILFVETSAEDAVIWSKPDDWEYDPNDPLDGISDIHAGGANIGMMDGSVQLINLSIDPEVWKALLTRAGGEQPPRF